jgi:MFS family permease
VTGLLLLAGSTFLFAAGTHMAAHLAARLVQGAAGACVNVSAFALVMEVSTDLARDMGVQEVVVGAGFMLGPTLGGYLFEWLGFRLMFVVLSFLPVIMAVVLVVVLRPLGVGMGRRKEGGKEEEKKEEEEGGEEAGLNAFSAAVGREERQSKGKEKELQDTRTASIDSKKEEEIEDGLLFHAPAEATPAAAAPFPPSSLSSTPLPTIATTTSSPPPSPATWWHHPSILLVSLALIADAAALGFLDPTLSQHLLLLLNLPSKAIGLVFALPPLLYSSAALLLVAPLTDRYGNKATITHGLLLVSLGFLLIGPLPLPSLPSSSSLPPSLPPSPSFIWTLLLFSLTLIGLGSALVVVPAVPLMLHAMSFSHLSSSSSSLPASLPSSLDFKDRIASLYTLAWSIGDALGPFLGGALTQLLPPVAEIVCPGGEEGGREGGGCQTSFRWSAAVLGLVVLVVAILVGVLVAPDVVVEEEEEEGGEEGGLRRRRERERRGEFLPLSPPRRVPHLVSARSLSSSGSPTSSTTRRTRRDEKGEEGEQRPLLSAQTSAHHPHHYQQTEGGLAGVGTYHAISHTHT